MQHIISSTTNKNKKDKDKAVTTTTKENYSDNDSEIIKEYAILLQALNINPKPEFHHLSLKTNLKDKEHYYRLVDWHTSSDANKAMVLENRISFHLTYKVMVYPNGKVIIIIGASMHPFKWGDSDDWISLVASCGPIHQTLRDRLSLSEPLFHISESDWIVKQFDLNYDVHMHPFLLSDSSSSSTDSKEPTTIIWPCIKVKQLGRVYQVYSKQLPYKGRCRRMEEQIIFQSHSPAPTLSSLPKTIISPLP